jgi:hypothetical protein
MYELCAIVQIDRFGHFKLWHIGGLILVGISFSVFGGCLLCTGEGVHGVVVFRHSETFIRNLANN